MMERATIYISLLVLLNACGSKTNNSMVAITESTTITQQYDFTKPDRQIILPNELKEISGISFLNDSILAAIGDNRPYLFFYNINAEKITSTIEIASNGDFEDVAIAKNTAYVLQSNGVLHVIDNLNGVPSIHKVQLPIETPFELEGMCLNEKADTLFIGAKYWHKDAVMGKGVLPVFAFLTATETLAAKPFFYVNRFYDQEKDEKLFHTAAMLRFENNKHWLLLSTNKKYLLELDENFKEQQLTVLNQVFFVQPEGISVDSKQNIYISNEGKNDKPSLLKFANKK